MNSSRKPILSQTKLGHENTRHFHAQIVRVFRGDSLWIVPVARGESGMIFSRISLRPQFGLFGLATLATAQLNARELGYAASAELITRLNRRYPSLRLIHAEDTPHYE